jgi:hypothetical protein
VKSEARRFLDRRRWRRGVKAGHDEENREGKKKEKFLQGAKVFVYLSSNS